MIFTGYKNIIGRVADFVAAIVLAVAFASCSDDAPDVVTGEDQSGMISFRVLAPKTATNASRATWGDDYEAEGGVEFETTILNDELYVMITDASCRESFAVTNLTCTRHLENALMSYYEYTGRLDEEAVEQVSKFENGKLHVVANAGYRPSLESATTFSYLGQPSSTFKAIPMWGVVQKADFSGLAESKTPFYVGDVSLLRAMAKVEISNGTTEYNNIRTIERVTISSANNRGYLLPQGWMAIGSTKDLDRNAVRIPDQIKRREVAYNFVDNHVEFYLPELYNRDDDEITLELEFTTISGESRTANLYFRDYNTWGEADGVPYDIRRNYLYRYTVNMLRDISASIDVVPYTSVELEPGFGFITPLPTVPNEGEYPGWVEVSP